MTLSDEIDETMDYWRMNDVIMDKEVMMIEIDGSEYQME